MIWVQAFGRTVFFESHRWAKVLSVLIVIGTLFVGSNPARGAWPGRNGRIAFSQQDKDDKVNIYSISRRGNEKSKLTDWKRNQVGPSFSPNGKFIVFERNREQDHAGKDWEVFRMNADGTHERRLTHRNGPVFSPTWSPNGKKILFSQRRGAPECGWCLFKMNRDGSNVERIQVSGKPDEPRWSPDGDRISFLRASDLYTADPDGSGQELVLEDIDAVDWSPDGDRFVTRCVHKGHKKICVFNEDGSGMRRARVRGLRHLTGEPKWSPNGRRILLMGQVRIVSVKPNGTDKRLVTRIPASPWTITASWQPR